MAKRTSTLRTIVLSAWVSACSGTIDMGASPGDRSPDADSAPIAAGDPAGSSGGSAHTGDKSGPTAADGGVPPPATQSLDCSKVRVGTTPLQRLSRVQYANSVRDLLGLSPSDAVQVSALAEDEKVGPFASNTVAPVSDLVVEQYTLAAESAARAAMPKLSDRVTCDRAKQGDAACATAFIAQFGMRAYRRPLVAGEQSAYEALYAAYAKSSDVADALRVVVQTMLQSPNFLYHVELEPASAATADAGALDPPASADTVALDPFELAARIAFFLTSTTPDDALLESARSGKLSSDAGLKAEVMRLIADPRASDTLASFHLQWLELDKLSGLSKDTKVYPLFDDALATAMRDESVHFVDYVMREGDAKLETLLTASYSFPEGRLFDVYGVKAPPAADAAKPIALDPSERAGLLTQPGFLAVHAHENQAAPVQRGKVVIKNVLCEGLPDPPPNVNTTPSAPSLTATTRERLSQHENNPSCSGCHKRIDGIGLGFSHYDGVGAFVTTEAGKAIDASGTLMNTQDLDGTFDGAVDLSKKLAASQEVQQCVTKQWLRFALGRMEADADACSLANLYETFDASGHDIRALLVAIVMSDAFRQKAVVSEASP